MDKPNLNVSVNTPISGNSTPELPSKKDTKIQKINSAQNRSLVNKDFYSSNQKGLIVKEESISKEFSEGSKSEKIESVFIGKIRASEPSPAAITEIKTPTPGITPSFASITIESYPFFKQNALRQPHYKFDISVNGKKLSLMGGGINPETGDIINAGGFGRIFSAIDPETGKKLAVKVAMASKELRGVVEKEGQALLDMGNAEYVVGASHVGFCEDMLFAVMDYVEGPVLIDRIMDADLPPLTLEEKIGFISDVIKGIKELHDAGYAHRDIKLDNIILENGIKGRVIDLGFAKKDEEETKSMEGTPFYLPPEMLSSLFKFRLEYKDIDPALKKSHTKAVDIYSLGVCIYAILQGAFPSNAKNIDPLKPQETLIRLATDFTIHPQSFEEYKEDLEADAMEALRDAVQNCMERIPEHRPLIGDLLGFFEGLKNQLRKKG